MRTEWVSEQLQDVAERVILPRFGALGVGEVEEKKPGDLVTVADREAEVELVRILSAVDPGSLVVGEEGVFADPGRLDALPSAERAWVIDPVDYFDLTPETLRADYKADYVLMVGEAYQADQDPGLAARRLAVFGSQSPSAIAANGLAYARDSGFVDTDIIQIQELVTALQAWSGIRP